MNIVVQTAAAIRPECPAASHALPVGFPFLVDRHAGKVIKPVLLFLVDQYLTAGRQFVPNTATAVANDLKDYLATLDEQGVAWNEATKEDVVRYRDDMAFAVSRKTHERYSVSTVRRRLASVLAFYAWAAKSRLIDTPILDGTLKRIPVPIEQNAMAHLGQKTRRVSELLPPDKRGADDQVKVLSQGDWKALSAALGPLPSERQDDQPARDRLACEMSLNTGLRIHELLALTTYQILPLCPDPSRPFVSQRVWVTITKGSRPRWIYIPNWLISEIHAYIDGERAECLKAARRHWLKRNRDTPAQLFLNGVSAKGNAGRPLRSQSLEDAFHRSAVNAGLVRMVRKTDPDTGEVYMKQEPRHVFHDLRHTFAVWTYYTRKAEGDAEPWKTIQARLGHRHVQTTMDIYLRHTDGFEATISDHMSKHYRSLHHGR
ncbi:hypothetical protein CRT60_00490 [Azospirillum palustre]|uniref:Integrase n=1 Tax=Azospirillum palustre TaxID=2044885 RepID=A0A2B8BNL2_9PROT|nr:tyrosine-type recombinase/integrase [Azospirillum palustre]PGH59445.1 hypothetical protein CRT60_00490 [Azospirillum palustre]